jgi:hypothetical protein
MMETATQTTLSSHQCASLPTHSCRSRCFARLRGGQCTTLIRRPWRTPFSAMVRMSFSVALRPTGANNRRRNSLSPGIRARRQCSGQYATPTLCPRLRVEELSAMQLTSARRATFHRYEYNTNSCDFGSRYPSDSEEASRNSKATAVGCFQRRLEDGTIFESPDWATRKS